MSPRQDGRYHNPAYDESDNGYRDNGYRDHYQRDPRDSKSRWPESRQSDRDRYSDRTSDRYSNGSKYSRNRHDSYRVDSQNGDDSRNWRTDERIREHNRGPIINDERQNKYKNDHSRITSQDQVLAITLITDH